MKLISIRLVSASCHHKIKRAESESEFFALFLNFQSILLYLKLLAGRGTNGGWVDGRTDGSVGKSLEHATLAAKVTTTTTSFQTAPPHSYNKGGPWLFWMANAKATLTKHGKKISYLHL